MHTIWNLENMSPSALYTYRYNVYDIIILNTRYNQFGSIIYHNMHSKLVSMAIWLISVQLIVQQYLVCS